VDSFKYLGSKIVTDRSVKEEITERLKNAEKFYQLVRDITLEMETYAYLKVIGCPY
jgi:hypothetical protein